MTHKLTVRSPEGVRHCDGCGGDHLGLRCEAGTRYKDRLKTTSLDGSVTATRTKRSYYEDESYKDLFGGYDRKERREKLLDDTHGYGPMSKNEDTSPEKFKAIMGFLPGEDD